MKKKTFAFIFARGGSKEIKNKNIKIFNSKPLIYYSINIAKKNKLIDEVFVSSDSKKILNIASKLGAKIIKRPKELSNDLSKEVHAWHHAIDYLEKKKIYFDNFISLPTTSPLRINNDINRSIKKIKKNNIVVGITKSSKHPYFNMLKKNSNNHVEPFLNKKFFFNRQEMSQAYDLTTLIYASSKKQVKKIKNSIWESKIDYINIPKERSIDIDTKFDFKIAEILYKKKL